MEKICNTCNKSLPIEMFYNNKSNRDGKMHDCKICRKEKIKSEKKYYPKQKLSQINLKADFLQLKGLSKEDYIMMYKLCESMGYDPKNDSKTIHEQFIEKWNIDLIRPLKVSKRNPRSITQYLYDGSINPDYKRS